MKAATSLHTFNDLERWLNERRVTEVECLVPDLTGVARGKILPRSKLTEDRGMRLPETIIGLTVTGELAGCQHLDRRSAQHQRPDMSWCPTRAPCAWCPGPPTRPRR
jgi:glutamine synthetase